MPHQIRFLGHAAFTVRTSGGRTIFLDPWLENPLSTMKLADVGAADLVLVTHDHADHVGQAVEIANKTGATVIAQPETVGRLQQQAGLKKECVIYGTGINISGMLDVKGIGVVMTPAFHSSLTGAPVGYVLRLEDGMTIYHAGDTGIFGDMRLIAEMYPIDLALLPVGGCFTMDPAQAARAVGLLRPQKVIPMHYATFPMLVKSADAFVDAAKKALPGVEVIVLKPGQEIAVEKPAARPAR